MSDEGLFLGLPDRETPIERARVASKSLAAARHEIYQKIGHFLKSATSVGEFEERLEMVRRGGHIEQVVARHLATISDAPAKLERALRADWERTADLETSDSGGQTCSVCGDSIERDPAGEEPRTWHHTSGGSHDHEAKSSGGDDKTAGEVPPQFLDQQQKKKDEGGEGGGGSVPPEFKEQQSKPLPDALKDGDGEKKDDEEGGEKKESLPPWLKDKDKESRVAQEGGQTCSVCGDSIARDPEGEEPRTWHHTDGTSHDHEAKPKESEGTTSKTADGIKGDAPKEPGTTKCPSCGGEIGSAAKFVGKCPHCGAEIEKFSMVQGSGSPLGKAALKFKDLPGSAGTGEAPASMMCSEFGEEHGVYSATRGDYFMMGDDEEVTCSECHAPMILVKHRDYYEPIASKTAQDDKDDNQPKGELRVDVAGVGEEVWTSNALTFDTPEEAKAYANNLLGRWTGADMARVVPESTPKREPVDINDPNIVVNYRRTGSAALIEDLMPGIVQVISRVLKNINFFEISAGQRFPEIRVGENVRLSDGRMGQVIDLDGNRFLVRLASHVAFTKEEADQVVAELHSLASEDCSVTQDEGGEYHVRVDAGGDEGVEHLTNRSDVDTWRAKHSGKQAQFGYDPELPAGFQDADFEMRELEDAADRHREEMRQKHKDGKHTEKEFGCPLCQKESKTADLVAEPMYPEKGGETYSLDPLKHEFKPYPPELNGQQKPACQICGYGKGMHEEGSAYREVFGGWEKPAIVSDAGQPSNKCPNCGSSINPTVQGDTMVGECKDCGWKGTKKKQSSLQKGAPFAGYKDFADCVSQNGDKDNPEAYCGKIKHEVEDKKSSLRPIIAEFVPADWPEIDAAIDASLNELGVDVGFEDVAVYASSYLSAGNVVTCKSCGKQFSMLGWDKKCPHCGTEFSEEQKAASK